MSQSDFGTWCAIAIHDTSSVVGAAESYGTEALETATTVKLARALWIIPCRLFLCGSLKEMARFQSLILSVSSYWLCLPIRFSPMLLSILTLKLLSFQK